MNNEENSKESSNNQNFIKPPIIHFPRKTPEVSEDDSNIENLDMNEPIAQPSLEIVGTAHISDKSVDSVRQTIYEKRPEIVAIELDLGRYQGLLDESRGMKREQKFDLKDILKSSNLTVTLVSMLLSHMQKKMGEEVGVSPGSEMLEASQIAQEVNASVALIDRNVQTTLKRTINGMSLREKLSFIWDLLKSFLLANETDKELAKEEIEELKQEDTIVEVMDFFKETSPGGFNALVHERDAYMAHHLKSLEDKNVVAVVGAGHKNGILTYLDNPETIPPIEGLNKIEESRFSILQIILYLIPIIFIIIFVGAYLQGMNIQNGLLDYLVFAGGGAFIGSLLSGSKVQSALVGMIVAPITVIHPLLAAGWFSGLVEGKLRNVGMNDFSDMAEFESFSDLWHNKLFRVILVVMGTNIGCTVGFLLTINNVFIPYLHGIFGI